MIYLKVHVNRVGDYDQYVHIILIVNSVSKPHFSHFQLQVNISKLFSAIVPSLYKTMVYMVLIPRAQSFLGLGHLLCFYGCLLKIYYDLYFCVCLRKAAFKNYQIILKKNSKLSNKTDILRKNLKTEQVPTKFQFGNSSDLCFLRFDF